MSRKLTPRDGSPARKVSVPRDTNAKIGSWWQSRTRQSGVGRGKRDQMGRDNNYCNAGCDKVSRREHEGKAGAKHRVTEREVEQERNATLTNISPK
jgi:hypothetical protein